MQLQPFVMRWFLFCAFLLAWAMPAHARSRRDLGNSRRTHRFASFHAHRLLVPTTVHLTRALPLPPPKPERALDQLGSRLSVCVDRAQHVGVGKWLWLSPVLPAGAYGLSVRVDR